jgi:hypothetical protein
MIKKNFPLGLLVLSLTSSVCLKDIYNDLDVNTI